MSVVLFSIVTVCTMNTYVLSKVFSIKRGGDLRALSTEVRNCNSMVKFLLLAITPLLYKVCFFGISGKLLKVLSLVYLVSTVTFFALFMVTSGPGCGKAVVTFRKL